jgi:hypothetical protein
MKEAVEKIMYKIPRKYREKIPGFSWMKNRYANSYFKGKDYTKHIKPFHNKHKGERCFILGSGPSLNKTDLSKIKGEYVFGCNKIYKLKNIDFSYYVVSDVFVWEKRTDVFLNMSIPLFLAGSAARDFIQKEGKYQKNTKNTILPLQDVGRMKEKGKIATDITNGIYWAETVIIEAIQIAYYMGFKEVCLLGCDCDYSGIHHFDGSKTDYTRGGGASGDWSEVFAGYRICKKDFEEDRRKIYNATIGGKLDVFERKRLEDIV